MHFSDLGSISEPLNPPLLFVPLNSAAVAPPADQDLLVERTGTTDNGQKRNPFRKAAKGTESLT